MDFVNMTISNRDALVELMMIPPTVTPLHILTSVSVMAMALIAVWKSSNDRASREKLLPPMAQCGFIRMIMKATSPDGPWFVLRLARSALGTIYRIRMTPFGLGPDFVVACDAKFAQSVLRDPENDKPTVFYKHFDSFTGDAPSLLTSEGHRWYHARKATFPAFSSKYVKRVNSIILEQVNQWVQEVLIPNHVEKEEPFEIAAALVRQVLKGISAAGFEYEMSNEEVELLLEEWEIIHKEIAKRFKNPLRQMFLPFTPSGQRYALALVRAHEFSKKVLKNYRALKDPKEGTIISLIANNPNYESDDDRIAEISLFFFAGHDTTGYTLAWTILELAKNPSEQSKLRNAVQNKSSDEWRNVLELQCAVKEGLRLHPVVAGGTWRVLKNDMKTDKYFFVKGTHIYIPFLAIFRNEEYVDKPDEFIPSRWVDPSDDLCSASFPFSLGRRNCMGQSLATAELYNCLATLIAGFEFAVYDEGKVDYFTSLKPVGAKLIAKKL
mmetsp:Transcript_7331/g.10824  ORF Transcript_7331/g.10824 Transcript_7331/m.10824 type:complete len:496 (+) Transcript_7331:334-1821(+)